MGGLGLPDADVMLCQAAIAKCVELYNEELQPGIVTLLGMVG